MPKFRSIADKNAKVLYLEINALGSDLLTTAKLNKGTAFTEIERQQFRLLGKLPYGIESLQQQEMRAYQQFFKKENNLEKHLYLRSLHNTNEVLFYKLVSQHLTEMLPILYTPTVGKAVEQFSHEFQQPRGLYLSYPDKEHIDEILENRLNPEVDIIVITDGEGVLGIGDQGIGGIDICIVKLMVYVLCAGVNPNCLLPVQIDVGTNNEQLLNDPMYLGWRHLRLVGEKYDEMIETVVSAIRRKLPRAYLHWEDFGRENARRNLERYHHQMCTFNDDMQGTGAVALVALLSALNRTKIPLTEQRIVIVGAGTAGTGIADQLCAGMIREGLSEQEALSRFYLVGRHGLIHDAMTNLTAFQKPYAQRLKGKSVTTLLQLYDVVQKFKPTVLIGCSGQGGIFTEAIIKTMAAQVEYPIIFPLSNPTEKSEATPDDLLNWTGGRALIATGSPFGQVDFRSEKISIAQCNNALIYPGIGLGVLVAQATRLSETMLWEACKALSSFANNTPDIKNALLPNFKDVQVISRCIALAVATQARREGLAKVKESVDLVKEIERQFWYPEYVNYHYSPSL